ncbi:MAG: M55 family metallopeptidase [Limnochordia bacterium]
MRIYIMTDQEGVAGVINSVDFSSPGARYYEVARELLTFEVNAAIEGGMAAGATEFLVVDGHGWGSIEPRLLHPAAKLLAGRPIGYPFGCDGTFAAAFSVGQHAKTNTPGGHLCHTGSFNVEQLLINGLSVGEMGCNFLFAGYFGVPTVFLSGDAAACAEARGLVPNIITVAVKEGIDRGPTYGLPTEQNRVYNGAAIHLHPEVARERIREAARSAVQKIGEIKPFFLEPPYELVSVLRPEEPNGKRKVAVNRADDLIELLRMPRRYVEDDDAERFL